MTLEDIKKDHEKIDQLAIIRVGVKERVNMYSKLTLLAITDELTEMAEYVQPYSESAYQNIMERVNELQAQIEQL